MLLPDDTLCEKITNALVGPGYLILDHSVPDEVLRGLSELLFQYESEGLKAAGIGRGKDFHQDQQVRGDSIRWLTSDNSSEATYLYWMDHLRKRLNQELFLGLQDYESHFAIYPAGAFYQKHLDAFKGNPGRKISTVLYLNQNWNVSSGGELVLYDAEDEPLQTIIPQYGRLVIFLSEMFPHEVKPASAIRRSIAGWFKIRSDFAV